MSESELYKAAKAVSDVSKVDDCDDHDLLDRIFLTIESLDKALEPVQSEHGVHQWRHETCKSCYYQSDEFCRIDSKIRRVNWYEGAELIWDCACAQWREDVED